MPSTPRARASCHEEGGRTHGGMVPVPAPKKRHAGVDRGSDAERLLECTCRGGVPASLLWTPHAKTERTSSAINEPQLLPGRPLASARPAAPSWGKVCSQPPAAASHEQGRSCADKRRESQRELCKVPPLRTKAGLCFLKTRIGTNCGEKKVRRHVKQRLAMHDIKFRPPTTHFHPEDN